MEQKELDSGHRNSEFRIPNNKKYSASLTDLERIVWPGGSKVTPKGWIIMPAVSGKKLRIGGPVKNGFTDLVKADKDEQTGAITAVGFCIDVFVAAVAMLPYARSYDFIPWMTTNGTYSDLVFQAYLQVVFPSKHFFFLFLKRKESFIIQYIVIF